MHEIITEAKIENIEVVGGDDNPRFDVTLDHGAQMHIFTDIDLRTGVLKIVDIWTKAGDHPESFATQSRNHSSYYTKGVRLGAGETRRLLRFIIDTVSEFATIKSIEGARMTGARAFSPKRDTSVKLFSN